MEENRHFCRLRLSRSDPLDEFAAADDRERRMNVLQLSHRLMAPPACTVAEGITIRTFTPPDTPGWLALRMRAFAAETPPVRLWLEADFIREMTSKPWWRNEHTWLALPTDKPNELIGAVTLACRKQMPIVHWLMVDPEWRRRGIGRLLIHQLELAVWESGDREIRLETHKNWQNAVELYTKLGYRNS